MIRIKLLAAFSICILFLSCQKIERVMMVSTGLTDSISAFSATVSGRIIDPGENATVYGHCYSRTAGALITSQKTELGIPAGNYYFKSSLSNLEPGTKYFVRAYIKTDHNIAYGKEISFVTLPLVPVYRASVIENSAPSVVIIALDIPLASTVPSSSSFIVTVNSLATTVSQVAVAENKILLTLSDSVCFGDVVRVSYLKPEDRPLQSLSGGLMASLISKEVLNNLLPPLPVPVYQGSSVEDASRNVIEINYSMTLNATLPDLSAFKVIVNSENVNITEVRINGSKVLLTLANAVSSGDVLTVGYTKPAKNPLQSVTGGIASSLQSQSVSNNIIPPPPVPAFTKAVIENAAPFIIEIIYDLPLANIVPDVTAFNAAVNSVKANISQVAILGNKVLLILTNAAIAGDQVTVSYTVPQVNPVQSASGAPAVSLSVQNAVNNIIPLIPVPVFEGAFVMDAAPKVVEMKYNLTLANVVPDVSAFTVTANSSNKNISGITITGNKVLLTLADAIAAGDLVTVAYSKPEFNPVQTSSGGIAAALGAVSVTNNVVPPPVAPVFTGASVESETSSILKMVYNLPLANIVPDVSAFTVTVNSVVRNISQVSMTENRILLNLTDPVVFDDNVTVSYTKPVNNPVQTSSGGLAESITARNVVNNVGPACITAVVNDAAPSIIEMTFSSTLANFIPDLSAFTLLVNSVQQQIISVSLYGNIVYLNLSRKIVDGDNASVAYARPVNNPLQSTSGKITPSFAGRAVMNNVKPASPVYLSSSVEDYTPSLLEMTYDLELANIVPSVSAFSVKVNSYTRYINSVAISGNKVRLILSKSIRLGDAITVSYTKPAVNALQTAAGGQAASLSARNVTNNVK